jgi:hypothetical protein
VEAVVPSICSFALAGLAKLPCIHIVSALRTSDSQSYGAVADASPITRRQQYRSGRAVRKPNGQSATPTGAAPSVQLSMQIRLKAPVRASQTIALAIAAA